MLFWGCTGLNAACLNATTLALIDAGIPLLDLLCACTAAYLDKTPVIGMSKQDLLQYSESPALQKCKRPFTFVKTTLAAGAQ